MRTPIDLHQLPFLSIPCAAQSMLGTLAWDDHVHACFLQDTPHTGPREHDPLMLLQQIAQMVLVASHVSPTRQDDDLPSHLSANPARTHSSSIAMHDRSCSFLSIAGFHPVHMPL